MSTLAAEQSTLGGCLLGGIAAFRQVAPVLRAAHFTKSEYQLIFQAMESLDAAGLQIDAVTVSQQLDQAGQLEAAGGLACLSELARNTPSAEHVATYAHFLSDNATRHNGTEPHLPKGAVQGQWQEPADLWGQFAPVAALPRNLLPPTIEAFAQGKPDTFNPAALAGAALAVCAVAASDNVQLVINPTWRERFCVWVGVYGPSSAAKTPTLKTAQRAIEKEQAERLEEYKKDLERWQAAKKAAQLSGEEFDDPRPQPTRYFTHSSTMAALTELEKLDEHGIGLFHNELSALIAAMDSSNEKSAAERGDWLAMYDGGVFYSDRILRGQVLVSNHSATILGAITTDKLTRLTRYSLADGLLSRMTLIAAPQMAPCADIEAMALDVYAAYASVVRRLLHSRPKKLHEVSLTEESKSVLGQFKKRWQEEAELYGESLPRYSERLGKLPGLAARMALGFAIIESAEFPSESLHREIDMPRTLNADTMRRACEFVRYLSEHDLAFYAAAAGQDETAPSVEMTRKVGSWILQTERSEFQIGDVTRGIPAWRDARKLDQLQAIELLDGLGWIRTDAPQIYLGQQFVRGVTWTVNPFVHERYRRQAATARRIAEEQKAKLERAVSERRQQLGLE